MIAPAVVLVTDARAPRARTLAVVRAAACALGPRLLVQHRDKTGARDAVLDDARALLAAAREAGARLVVNGRLDVAVAAGADGVHLGGDARCDVDDVRRAIGPRAFVSIAAHDDDDVRRAIARGADAALVSPIFASPGKGSPRGVEAIARAREIARDAGAKLLVYALGGVDAPRAASCVEAGADGVAVIRALYDADLSDVAAVALTLAVAGRGVGC